MKSSVTVSRGGVLGVAAAVLIAGLAVGGGALLGGYALGAAQPVEAPTELAEKAYTDADLEAALAVCEVDGAPVKDGVLTMSGTDFPGYLRQCVLEEMGASTLAAREYGYDAAGTPESFRPDAGEHSWSNVTMTWKQTENGRDLTISVKS